MDEQNELVKDFLIESFEYLDSLDEDLLEIESQSEDPEVIARIFRAVHTIKGTGGFLNFEKLVGIAHVGEELLDAIRKDKVAADTEVVGALFELVDALREVLTSIEETGKDGEKVYAELIETLKSLQSGQKVAAAPAPAASAPVPAAAPAPTSGSEPSAPAPPPPEQKSIQPAPATQQPPASEQSDVEGKDDIIKEFLAQSFQHLDDAEKAVDELKPGTPYTDLVNEILSHSEVIRGTGGFLSYQNLSRLLLEFRNLLNSVKNKKISLDADVCSTLKDIISGTRQILASIDFLGTEGDLNFANLIERATRLKDGIKAEEAVENTAPPAEAAPENKPDGEDSSPSSTSQSPSETPGETKEQDTSSEKKGGGQNHKDKGSLTDNSIRVDVALLDSLMNLVGELVLTRNQILQFTTENSNLGLANSTQDLNLITTELQEGVMKTRMQTIGTIWRKFPRVVRDLSKACNKQARVEMEGEDTELDKTIIEAIKDPLTHLVRNSVDHGIEPPEERIKKGKSAEGRLLLHAFHEGGSVIIEITDDGGGIDAEKVKNKAIANGVITQAEAARMTDREFHNLIFMPGLSTAKQVSNISGRGVGMDVVKTYIERIGGTVEVLSQLGKGTTIRIKIPLTLAIIPALMVKVNAHRFAIPQVNLLELVRLEGEQIKQNIETVKGTPIYRLRGKLLPLVYLKQELELDCQQPELAAIEKAASEKKNDEDIAINIIVLQAEDQVFGLVVDEVIDTEEVVVKPLSKLLKSIPVLSGATIMGDGKVALILDVVGIARNSSVMSKDHALRSQKTVVGSRSGGKLTTFLLARVSEERQIAVVLSNISRLEEIKVSALETAGNQTVIQYRGYLMPLVWLTELLGGSRTSLTESGEFLQVIVCTKNGLNVGLVVDEIVDVVDGELTEKQGDGLINAVQVIQGQVTEILNIQEVLKLLDTGLLEKEMTT